jgi:apolipoprotein N-acyltransferase
VSLTTALAGMRLAERAALRAVIAAVAGAVAVGGFAPLAQPLLALAACIVLVQLWQLAPSPRAAFGVGFWFGLGLFGAGVSWVFVSLARFGGMPAPLAGVATLGFCAYLALYPACAGWLQARAPGPPWVRAALVAPAAWTVLEWMRGWVLTGFPWLAMGYAAIDTPLAGYAPLGGVYLLSLASLACAGALCCLISGQGRAQAAVAVGLIVAAGAALQTVRWTTPVGVATHITLLQGNVPQDLKFDPARYARTLETYAQLAELSQARLIVMPETALPRFLDLVEPAYLARLEALGRRNGGDLLIGAPLRDASGRYTNSVISLGTSRRQAYHKVHLVPFGEFVPPGFAWVMRWLSVPLSDFSSGARDQPLLEVAGQRVAVNVCYEDAYGAAIARALPAATLIVNVSNVAWFGDSLAPAQHLEIARMRALETGRMVLTATNTGITAAIGANGALLGRLPQFTQGRLELAALAYSGATPFVRLGNSLALVLAAVLLAAALIVARLQRSR